MAEVRFTVKWLKKPHNVGANQEGWHVLDNGINITVAYPSKEDALWHLDNIKRIYERYGW